MAWLNAIPGKGDAAKSRIAEMREQDITPSVPDNPLPYITDILFEIGPVVPAGMGASVISWRDMAAWQEVVGIRLKAWEGRALRNLSAAYLDQQHKSKASGCPPPWTESAAMIEDRVTAQFAAMLKAMAKDGKGR